MTIRALPPALQKQAEEQLNEVPDRIQEDLECIREWLKKQPHLIARTDDQWLLSFLRNCKFSLQRTKEKLELFYTVRTVASDYFINRNTNLPDVQEFYKKGMMILLPRTKDSLAPSTVLTINGDIDPDIVNPTVVGRSLSMLLDNGLMEDDYLTVCGVQWVLDLKNIPFKYGVQITPAVVKKWVTVFEKSYPLRVKSVHVINLPTFIEPVINLALKLLREKISKRVKIYSENNINDLYKSIPQSIFPNEYGGSAGPKQELIADVLKRLDSYNDWYKDDLKYHSDEKKRIGKPVTSAELLGIEGSFRKLDLD